MIGTPVLRQINQHILNLVIVRMNGQYRKRCKRVIAHISHSSTTNPRSA